MEIVFLKKKNKKKTNKQTNRYKKREENKHELFKYPTSLHVWK